MDDRIAYRQPAFAILVNQIDEHDGVGHDNSDQHEHADERWHAERNTGDDL